MSRHSELRLGLLGCGFFGRSLATVLTTLPGVRLVAVADVSAQAARSLAATCGAEPRDPELLAGSPDLDAVVVATPNDQHVAPVLAACAAGRHVFVEKPMALTVADCERMLTAARQAGVRIVVGHIMRTFPAVARIRALLDSGALGPVRSARATRARWIEPGGGSADWWKRDPGRTGGELRHEIHELDLLCWLLGEPRQLTGYHNDGIDEVLLRFPGGAVASYTLSTVHRVPSWGLSIQCGHGAVELDLRAATLTVTDGAGSTVSGVFDEPDADASLRCAASRPQAYHAPTGPLPRWMRRAIELELADVVEVFCDPHRGSPLLDAPARAIGVAERFLRLHQDTPVGEPATT